MASSRNSLLNDTAIRPFLAEVRRRHGIVDQLALPNMRDLPPIQIETLFVQPLLSVQPVNPTVDSENWPTGQSLFRSLADFPRIVLLGDPGSGKTTLSNWLAWRLSSDLSSPLPEFLEGRVPIPCVLRDIDEGFLRTIPDIQKLGIEIAKKLIPQADPATLASLNSWIRRKRYVLILDGIDEIRVEQREVVAQWLKQAQADDAIAVATSRIVGYEDLSVDGPSKNGPKSLLGQKQSLKSSRSYRPFERQPSSPEDYTKLLVGLAEGGRWNDSTSPMSSLVDEHDSLSQHTWAAKRYLMPFDSVRISAFVHNWYLQRTGSEVEAKSRSEDLLKALEQSSVTRELSRTPNLLNLIAIVHRERANLPDGKAWLYKEIANAYLNTIDSHRKIQGDELISKYAWETKESWLAFVGFRMQLQRTEESIHSTGVLVDESRVMDWLKEAMELSGVTETDTLAREFLNWVARRSGLLLPRGEGRFAFVHLSFQEYFCARFLAARIISPAFARKLSSADGTVSDKLLFEWAGHVEWREVYIYLFELISGERDKEWIDLLSEITLQANQDDLEDAYVELVGKLLNNTHISLVEDTRISILRRCCTFIIARIGDGKLESHHPIILSLIKDRLLFAISGEDNKTQLNQKSIDELSENTLILALTHQNLVGLNFEKLRELRLFALYKSHIDDLRGVVRLKNLTNLDLTASTFPDLNYECELPRLEKLELTASSVSRLDFVGEIPSLMDLNFDKTAVSDIAPLSKLRNLAFLSADRTKIKDLSPISQLQKLRILSISGIQATDYSAIQNLKELLMLSLSKSNIKDIEFLRPLKKLRGINLTNTVIDDLSPLTDLNSLQYAYLGGLNIDNIDCLRNHKNLEFLDISDTKVYNEDQLLKFKSLSTLDISGTKIFNIRNLSGLGNLRQLIVDSNLDISEFSKLREDVEIKVRSLNQ